MARGGDACGQCMPLSGGVSSLRENLGARRREAPLLWRCASPVRRLALLALVDAWLLAGMLCKVSAGWVGERGSSSCTRREISRGGGVSIGRSVGCDGDRKETPRVFAERGLSGSGGLRGVLAAKL